jgi:hypothetical protein
MPSLTAAMKEFRREGVPAEAIKGRDTARSASMARIRSPLLLKTDLRGAGENRLSATPYCKPV